MKNVSVLAAKRLGISQCACDTALGEIARMMDKDDISSLVVVDEDGFLEGIVTRTDVVRAALERPEDWEEAPCCDWMTDEVITVQPSTSLASTAQILQAKHIHRVVVVQPDGEHLRPIAVLSDSDIIYHLVNRDR
ncbi:MAG TPA: CBS domain-containing protein [Caldilineae bacterium]|nr:CBS domain-containing protein [Caldilineae bacterium]